MNPFLTLENPNVFAKELYACFPDIPKREIKQALIKAKIAEAEYKAG